ncbi:T-complex protein 1 subunit eta-like [Glycine soja]|uniref:T-complex protein 1 subunit eta-like n=1 Tax=Glycine max TaxID=3847 RepID=UPI0003DE76AD|nr:T-complex protein 1 subunit eta-like [Glycine max]XP_028230938.1 T-complex protein 1 subunit eta-like [Glycine soja]|eukprot:XP_006579667.1 T-complex protein 1 subunit eta-like [Glycine max]
MDKLIHDDKGAVTISNDDATIMKLLDIVHPAAKILADIAKSQDSEYFNEVRPLEAERFKALRIQWAQYYLKVRDQT